MSEYTKYFDNCKAVFQGGGCKAIAYIGAYECAYSHGVFFSELAGTSAGAIIAAFIAAGASPDDLKKLVKDTDFKAFAKNSVKPSVTEKLILKSVDISSTGLSVAHNVRNHFGLYSLDVLEEFVEYHLRAYTQKKQEIRFVDLIPNLHIVSADISTHSIKIWSKDETPNERVSKAVCASCALPIFFIPVDGRYVDGGLLCNLPNFVFAENAHYSKILSFRFITQQKESNGLHTFKEYFSNLIDTIVQGADEFHKLLTPNQETYDIPINVTATKTTDFSKINSKVIDNLVEIGRDATDAFFKNEKFFSYSKPNRVTKQLNSLEEVHSLVAYLGNDTHKEVIVSYKNTKWTWMLFPTILKWCSNETIVTIYYENEDFDKWSGARKRMLEAMNIKLVQQQKIPCEGFFFLGNETWKGIVITLANNDKFYAKYYNDTIDNATIKLVINNFQERSLTKSNNPNLVPIETNSLFKLLKSERLYHQTEFELIEIEIEKLRFMNPFIRALKYKQIDIMFRLYQDANLPLFSPASIRLAPRGKESIVGLPVVEECGNNLYVIEGNTRLTYAYRHGIKSMYVVLVKGVQTPLPCGPIESFYSVKDILITDKKIEGVERFGKDWDYSTFRHIEGSLRPAQTYLNDNPE